MSEKVKVLTKFRQAWTDKADKLMYRFALTGDGSDAETANVDGRPKYAWVRYNEKPDRVSQVLNLRFPDIPQGVPVIIGKQYPHDRYYQILDINTSLYYEHWANNTITQYLLAKHGDTHTWGTGNDPAPITTGNIVNGKVVATSPASMGVYVYQMIYEYNGTLATWDGGNVDLTGYAPGATSYHRYVLISFDVIEQAMITTISQPSPITIPPTIPSPRNWSIPLAVVRVEQGDTTIAMEDIYDYRILFPPIGGRNLERNFYQFMHYNELLWTRHLSGEI